MRAFFNSLLGYFLTPWGIILMGARPAEIGEHTVTHELRDVTVETCNLARNCLVIGAY